LREFENRALRRIFGPNRDEVTRGWGRLHSKQIYNFYASSYIIRMMRWAGHVACMEAMKNSKF